MTLEGVLVNGVVTCAWVAEVQLLDSWLEVAWHQEPGAVFVAGQLIRLTRSTVAWIGRRLVSATLICPMKIEIIALALARFGQFGRPGEPGLSYLLAVWSRSQQPQRTLSIRRQAEPNPARWFWQSGAP